MDRIKLVVFNNHTLGYIDPLRPKFVSVLHASVLRGAPWVCPAAVEPILISPTDKIRLASKKDFDDFMVDFNGFDNDQIYEYAKQ